MKYTVTVIDTTGKQNYIFKSNRLRENSGASFLLLQATQYWIEDILDQKFNVPKGRQEDAIEKSQLNAERIYANGGNALIVFKSREIAVKFTQILSRKVLEEAPGIHLLVAHKDFDWNDEIDNNLYAVVEDLKKSDIERQKYERMSSAPLLGLGVSASCNSTLLPAVGKSEKYVDYGDEEDADSYLVSTETKKKLEVVSQANTKLQEIFANEVDRNIYKFPYRTDHLGRSKGESSYAAVIHVDGNGMGERFKNHGKGKTNRDYINAIRDFSKSVDIAGINALKAVARVLVKSIQQGKVVGNLGEFNLNAQGYLPFRPLVYAGDDITFISEARIGIELAALFLQAFENQTVSDGKALTACAGVCVVKTHYPFARAYAISEELCKSAKKFVKESKFEDESFSALDWHLAASGLIGSISEIRDREYKIYNDRGIYDLTMRPVRLRSDRSDWRTWNGFTQVVREFKIGENWKGKHNKVMALREVLRQASDKAVEEFLWNYSKSSQLQLPFFPKSSSQNEQLSKNGWLNRRCGYFDAIEAMEFYLDLEG
ncbi:MULTISPECIES: Cas10/Cmr2 second palm domain-containing protein [Nostocales]|uniref:Cas10/Cmr2 second palm domain-containing protein n=4 Tax=Nostocales TaxID=1161 RepID=A0A8S9TEN3_9CYAN|nr:hypothetical protein [Tolypothrix bouteillei]KAF3890054.1 hypothetical protein DA73_0400034795 [Tolypothrix bouteillei VB521301]